MIRAGLVLCAAADKLNAERVTFPLSMVLNPIVNACAHSVTRRHLCC
jgi:hypothetical protein